MIPMTDLQRLLNNIHACREARAWVAGRTLDEAIRDCSRGDWLIWLYEQMAGQPGWPTLSEVRLTVCDFVRQVAMPHAHKDDVAILEHALDLRERRERGDKSVSDGMMASAARAAWAASADREASAAWAASEAAGAASAACAAGGTWDAAAAAARDASDASEAAWATWAARAAAWTAGEAARATARAAAWAAGEAARAAWATWGASDASEAPGDADLPVCSIIRQRLTPGPLPQEVSNGTVS